MTGIKVKVFGVLLIGSLLLSGCLLAKPKSTKNAKNKGNKVKVHRAPVVNLRDQNSDISMKQHQTLQRNHTLESKNSKPASSNQSVLVTPLRIVPAVKKSPSSNVKNSNVKNNVKRNNTHERNNTQKTQAKGRSTQQNQNKMDVKLPLKQVKWAWPHRGPLLRHFQENHSKGIDIGGLPGHAVKASGQGTVVYSGSGLKGYGNLVIIKHDEDFLSAYAHNEKLMVKEGERVVAGQEIAKIGKTDTDRVKLHFEIRYKGKPVDPLKFLPR